MTDCDFGAGECASVATAMLRFRGQPGHVHVCPTHEGLDREYADVVDSAPMPMSVCPVVGCAEVGRIGAGIPTLLPS